MTNKELKTTLEDALKGSVDEETISLLMEACIHAALKTNYSLRSVSAGFARLAALYSVIYEIMSLPLSPELTLKNEPENTNKIIDKLLEDIKLDLD
jgi:hypothetical protein